MQDWIKTEVEINCKKLTVKEYLRSCSLYIDIVGDHPIQTFRKHHSISYKSGLDDMQLSDSGIKKHQTHLQIFLNWAYSEEYIEKPIRINKVRITKKSPVIYNSDEINLIQSVIEKAIYDSPDSYRKKFAENHLRAFMLARYAVMRNGEILSMPLRNLLIDEGVIQITEVPEIPWTPKTRQERIIPISPELNKFLIKDLKKRDSSEKWFLDNGGGSLAYSDKSQLSQVFRRYINRTGLNVPGRKPLHAFRSSGITGILSNGGKLEFVMKIAGHSNPQTTLNHYVRAENFDLRETMNLVSDN